MNLLKTFFVEDDGSQCLQDKMIMVWLIYNTHAAFSYLLHAKAITMLISTFHCRWLQVSFLNFIYCSSTYRHKDWNCLYYSQHSIHRRNYPPYWYTQHCHHSCQCSNHTHQHLKLEITKLEQWQYSNSKGIYNEKKIKSITIKFLSLFIIFILVHRCHLQNKI